MTKDFSNIIGHEQIISYFQNAIAADKISHAYILNAPDKSGKMMLAEAFAAALQCEKRESKPCGKCHSCRQAESRNHPDIRYVTHEKQGTLGVEDVRRQINDDIVLKPYSGRYRIYIVDEAEKMNAQAQNALLKTIEEPPSYAVLILLTDNADGFLPTILSRCVRLDLKAVADEKIHRFLTEEKQVSDDKADICVAFAQGNVGKALQLSASEQFNEIKNLALQLVKRIKEIDLYEMSQAVRQITEYKLEIGDFLDLMLLWYRDVLLYKATADVNRLVFQDEIYSIKKAASQSSYGGIEQVLRSLEKAKMRLRANVNFELVMELLLYTMKEN